MGKKGYRPCAHLGSWRHFGSDVKKLSSRNPRPTRLVTDKKIHMKEKQNMHFGHEDSRLAEAKPICFAFFFS